MQYTIECTTACRFLFIIKSLWTRPCSVYRTLLRSPDVQKDPRRYLQAVQKVIACMTLGIDVSKLFSEMIMVSQYTFVDACEPLYGNGI